MPRAESISEAPPAFTGPPGRRIIAPTRAAPAAAGHTEVKRGEVPAPVSRRRRRSRSEDEGKAVMDAWMAWFDGLGAAVVDAGNPTAAARSVAPGGAVTDHDRGDVTGYSILEADTLDAAVTMATGCPHLAAGGTVTVHETFEVMYGEVRPGAARRRRQDVADQGGRPRRVGLTPVPAGRSPAYRPEWRPMRSPLTTRAASLKR